MRIEPFVLIQASAGTGKTYSLVKRLLQLLYSGAEPRKIFATTFTRKAAAEIKERLLKTLSLAVLGESTELSSMLEVGDKSENKSEEILRRLLKEPLEVSTIDSYLSNLAQVFRFEMGLPEGFRVADEGEMTRALDRTMLDLLESEDPQKISALTKLLKDDRSVRSVFANLKSTVSEALSLWHEGEGEERILAWAAWLSNPDRPKQTQWDEAFNKLSAAELPLTKGGKVDSRFSKGAALLLQSIEELNLRAIVSHGFISTALAEAYAYHGVEFSPSLREAVAEVLELTKRTVMSDLRLKALAHYELLNWFSEHYFRHLKEERVLGFDEIKELLKISLESEWAATLTFRMDLHFDHILFDEFQDTSLNQWRFFAPFFEELLPADLGSRTAFIVGDSKQSIYGWRGGNKALFDHVIQLAERLSGSVVPLSTSYRSTVPVMECVNALFSRLPGTQAASRYPNELAIWLKSCAPHQTVRLSERGQIAIKKVEDNLMVECAELIYQLSKNNPELTIGVITRKNKQLREISTVLAKLHPELKVSREGGTPLSEEKVVLSILAALTVMDHPGDQVYRFYLANSLLGHALNYTDYRDTAKTAALARDLRVRLERGGVYLLVKWLASLIEERLSANAWLALSRFLEVILPIATHFAARPSELIRVASKTTFEAGSDAKVRLMTAHKAKGLEFDLVVLPDLSSELIKNPAFFSKRDNPNAPPTRIFRTEREDICRLFPEIEELRRHARGVIFDEALSILYVMVTRAKNGVFFLCQSSAPRESYQRIVEESLGVEEAQEWQTLFGEPGLYV